MNRDDSAIQTEWSGHHVDKDRLRATVWARLKAHGAAVGEPAGHIPRFVGSDQAAARLATLPMWQAARVIKCNPDAAQAPVRRRALQEGKVLYLKLGLLRQMGLVQAETPITTTVHGLQIVPSVDLPMLPHDWSLTWIVTPDEIIATQSQHPQPTGLYWESLRPEQLQDIPVLRTLQPDLRHPQA
jgi:5-formyltetrahydrofolate cyclo-ligase